MIDQEVTEQAREGGVMTIGQYGVTWEGVRAVGLASAWHFFALIILQRDLCLP